MIKHMAGILAGAFFASSATAQVSAGIGTLPPGDSIVVYFDVAINNPLPAGVHTIRTRGRVSGTNFADALTDDPDTVPADSTLTAIDEVPVFANTGLQLLSLCQNGGAEALSSMLVVNDPDTWQTLTWTVQSPPGHGTLAGFPASAPADINAMPASVTYTPAAGYAGNDDFTISVSDGIATDQLVISVVVNPAISGNTISGSQTVCAGGTPAALTGNTPSGGDGGYAYEWQSSTTSASSGFATAGGTADQPGYTPPSPAVSTWYRRVVSSGGCTSTSAAVLLSVDPNNYWTGQQDTHWSNPANWSCGNIPVSTTDVFIGGLLFNYPEIDIPNATAHNITITDGIYLSYSGLSNVLDVKGNISGNFDAGNGKLVLSGSGAQDVPGISYKDLQVSGSGNKTLAGPVNVTGSLTLTNGYILLGANDLTLGNSTAVTGGSAASFIVTNGTGSVIRQQLGSGAITFPVGSSTGSYTPATMANAGTADNYTVRVIDNIYNSYTGNTASGTPIAAKAVGKTWFITEAVAGGSDVTLTLQWNGVNELTGFDRTRAALMHFVGGSWQYSPAAAAAGGNPYTRTLSGVNSFSPFGIGNIINPLPLNLLSFTGNTCGEYACLSWQAADDRTIAAYEVQHSPNGRDFTASGTVKAYKAQGQSSYAFEDRSAHASYYRLRIMAEEGTDEYSRTIALKGEMSAGRTGIYPNPVRGAEVVIRFGNAVTGPADLILRDAVGRTLRTVAVDANILKTGALTMSTADLPAGIYLVQLVNAQTGALASYRLIRE